jgi:hypothetical protein
LKIAGENIVGEKMHLYKRRIRETWLVRSSTVV